MRCKSVMVGLGLLVSGEDGATAQSVSNIRTIDVCNCVLESSHFVEGGVFWQVEIKLSWFVTMPRPDEVANPNQPPGAVNESRSGNFLGEGE